MTAPSLVNDEVTAAIDQIVLKALQKEPANRYQTAGEMQRDIDAVLYTFKPTPTSADLAIYMHRLNTAEPSPARVDAPLVHEPEPEPLPANELRPIAVPLPPPTPAPVAQAVPMPAWEPPAATVATTPAKKSPVVAIIIGLVVVAAAVGGYFAFRGKPPATAVTKSAAPVNKTASAAPPPILPAPTTTVSPLPGTVAPTSTAPVIDTTKVNEEVQKRLAAEKTRLEQQARQQTTTQAPVLGRTTPAPQPQPVATQTVAPATQTVAPAPQPVVPAPQPVAPAPVPAPEPQVQRAQLGELVPSGTEGLNPARISHQAAATYPPIARMQRMQGTVIVNALINENGQVVETKILSSASTILNEAAVQSVRRSTFTPGKFYTYRDVPIELEPLQRPHPPLWYGVSDPSSVPWAAQNRLNIVCNGPAAMVRGVITDQQKKFYETTLQVTKQEVSDLKDQIEEELAKVKDRIAELQNAINASKQMYAAACARLGQPNDMEDEEGGEG